MGRTNIDGKLSTQVLSLYHAHLQRRFSSGRWVSEERRFAAFLQALASLFPEQDTLLLFWRVWAAYREAALPRHTVRGEPMDVVRYQAPRGRTVSACMEDWVHDLVGFDPWPCQICGEIYDEGPTCISVQWFDPATGVLCNVQKAGYRPSVLVSCSSCDPYGWNREPGKAVSRDTWFHSNRWRSVSPGRALSGAFDRALRSDE